jgi:uncharacterized protein
MSRILTTLSNRPWIVFLAVTLISVAAFMAMKGGIRMETNLDEYMPKDHPEFLFSDQAEQWFDIKDGVIIAIENPDGIYNPGTLSKIKELTRALQQHELIERGDVTSLYSADNITGSEEGLDVRPFFKKVPETEAELSALRTSVLDNRMVQGRLVSDDETITLVIARLNDDAFSQDFYHEILDLVKTYEGEETLYVAGRPIIEGTLAYLGPIDMKKMVPIVILVIIVVLMLVLRSVRNTIFTMLVVVLSTLWTFGLMAACGIPVYAVTTMIPVMLIAIGVADGIHLYSHLKLFRQDNPEVERRQAVTDLIRNMWKPVVMTSVTTAVGFVSLLTSEVFPIKYFGLFTAFGVLSAMVLSLVLVPAGLMAFGESKQKAVRRKRGGNEIFFRLARLVTRHRRSIIITTLILIVVSAYGTSKVWINSSFLEKFELDSDIVLTDQFINENFGGTSTLNVILKSDQDGTFMEPEVLRAMDAMQAECETVDEVGDSFGLTDYLRQINRSLHADDDAFFTIPDTRELVAQYLLLYEMSGDPEKIWETVDYDYAMSNVTLQLKGDDSKTINLALEIIESYQPLFDDLGIEINYAGSGYKGLIFSDLILEGQIKSLLLSLVIIVLLLAMMFRKFIAGLISAIPIAITAIVNFGAMGLLGIPLSTTTALISSIAIGIGIDYAVHFMSRYKIYALETGDMVTTIKKTMAHSGRAIYFNALVVIAGFMVLLFSAFPPNRALGALVSFNMFISLLGTVTVMLVVMVMTRVYFRDRYPEQTISEVLGLKAPTNRKEDPNE